MCSIMRGLNTDDGVVLGGLVVQVLNRDHSFYRIPDGIVRRPHRKPRHTDEHAAPRLLWGCGRGTNATVDDCPACQRRLELGLGLAPRQLGHDARLKALLHPHVWRRGHGRARSSTRHVGSTTVAVELTVRLEFGVVASAIVDAGSYLHNGAVQGLDGFGRLLGCAVLDEEEALGASGGEQGRRACAPCSVTGDADVHNLEARTRVSISGRGPGRGLVYVCNTQGNTPRRIEQTRSSRHLR